MSHEIEQIRISNMKAKILEKDRKSREEGDENNILLEENTEDAAEAYIENKIKEYVEGLGMSKDAVLNMIENTLGLDEDEEEYSLETHISKIRLGDTGIHVKGKVLSATATITPPNKNGMTFNIVSLIIGQDSAHILLKFFAPMEYNSLYSLFTAIFNNEADEMIEKDVILTSVKAIKGGKYDNGYEIVLQPARGFNITFLDDVEVECNPYIENVNQELSSPISVKGKVSEIHDLKEFASKKDEEKTNKLRSFDLVFKNKQFITVQVWNNAMPDFPEKGQIVALHGVLPKLRESDIQFGVLAKTVDVFNKGVIQVLNEDASLYPDAKTKIDVPVSRIIDVYEINKPFETVGYITSLFYNKYEENEQGEFEKVSQPPYYLQCNFDLGNDSRCLVKTELKDGEYVCKHNHIQPKTEIQRKLLMNAIFYDFSHEIRLFLSSRSLTSLFGEMTENQILEIYDSIEGDTENKNRQLFEKLKNIVMGKIFKVKGIYTLDEKYGFNFKMLDIEPISIQTGIETLKSQIVPV